jgi:thiol:disulfide interchange protein DsbD
MKARILPELLCVIVMSLGCTPKVVKPVCNPSFPVVRDFPVPYLERLQDAIACSKNTGRPILLLFSGWAIGPSPDRPFDVFAEDDIRELLVDRLVLCVLMVDDKQTINEADLDGFPDLQEVPNTIGQRNTMLEQLYFNKQSQPLYVLVNADMVPYSEPLGYSPRKEVGEFVKWMENSLRELP